MKWHKDYVYVDHGPGFRTQHAQAWPGDETATMAFSHPDWAKQHVLTAGGSAYLPERMVRREIDTGTLFPVEGAPTFEKATYLSWRKSSAVRFPWLDDAERN